VATRSAIPWLWMRAIAAASSRRAGRNGTPTGKWHNTTLAPQASWGRAWKAATP